MDEELWQSLVSPWKIPVSQTICRPVGCLECRETGYLGRVGIYEILMLTPALRRLIQPDMDVSRIREQAMREGMYPLHISGAKKICAGLTTLDEVFRVAGVGDKL
jgi:general secretion pathway protein E